MKQNAVPLGLAKRKFKKGNYICVDKMEALGYIWQLIIVCVWGP